MRHIIAILLRNEAGALARVASLFSTRGYNIESLSVAPTDDPQISRLTLVTFGNDQIIGQINKQLFKLVDVVDLADMTRGDHIERELLLLKVRAEAAAVERLKELVRAEQGRILDDSPATFTLEVTGPGSRLDSIVERVAGQAEILSVVRSGPLAVARGAPAMSVAQATGTASS